MILICPKCNQRQTVTPNSLLGHYFVCRFCHSVEPWTETISVETQNENEEEDKNKNDGADNPNGGAGHTFIIP